jgi:hypothetical protein
MKPKEFSRYLDKIGCRIECKNEDGRKSVEVIAAERDEKGNTVLTKAGNPNETSVMKVYSEKKNDSYIEMVNYLHLQLLTYGVGYIIMARVEERASETTADAKEAGLMDEKAEDNQVDLEDMIAEVESEEPASKLKVVKKASKKKKAGK